MWIGVPTRQVCPEMNIQMERNPSPVRSSAPPLPALRRVPSRYIPLHPVTFRYIPLHSAGSQSLVFSDPDATSNASTAVQNTTSTSHTSTADLSLLLRMVKLVKLLRLLRLARLFRFISFVQDKLMTSIGVLRLLKLVTACNGV